MGYKDIKFFNKKGMEIPLLTGANVVLTTGLDDPRYDDTVLHATAKCDTSSGDYYLDDFAIISRGDSFSADTSVIELFVYINGKMAKGPDGPDKCVITEENPGAFSSCLVPFYGIEEGNSHRIDKNANGETERVKYGLGSLSGLHLEHRLYPGGYSPDDIISPGYAFVGKLDIDRVSTGLAETECLYMGIRSESGELLRPSDPVFDFKFVVNDLQDEIRFFNVNPITESIEWAHSIYYDLSEERIDTGNEDDIIIIDNNVQPQINIGFLSMTEGCFEEVVYVVAVNRETKEEFKVGEIVVNAEAEGEDERYRTLFSNFGIADPAVYPHLFRDADPNETMTDWMQVNAKSKELFLTYTEIFPYIGTYKALINAVNYLGYDDVYFREWYKKYNKDRSERVSYRIDLNGVFGDQDARTHLSLDTRLNQKKLNELTMVYLLNRETGETDMWDVPIVENVYKWSIDEILLKLIALREWLQRNIIALNCRIIDITGEGVVYERMDQTISGQYTQNLDYEDVININAKLVDKTVELLDGSAFIDVQVLPKSIGNYYMTFGDFANLSIEDLAGTVCVDMEDGKAVMAGSALAGPTFEYPLLYNANVKGYLDTSRAIISENISRPLWVNDGELFFLNTGNTDEVEDAVWAKAPIIQLESANFRMDNGDWHNNVAYRVERLSGQASSFSVTNVNTGKTLFSTDYVVLYPRYDVDGTELSSIRYTMDNEFNVPLLKVKGYRMVLSGKDSGLRESVSFLNEDVEYILEIFDGKLVMTDSFRTEDSVEGEDVPQSAEKTIAEGGDIVSTPSVVSVLNFNYDTSSYEQNVTMTYEYTGSFSALPRYGTDENGNLVGNVEPVYRLNVNHIGDYKMFVYFFNRNGNIFAQRIDTATVTMPRAEVCAYTHIPLSENSSLFHENTAPVDNNFRENGIDVSSFLYKDGDYNDEKPIFRESYLLSGLTYTIDKKNGLYFIEYPNYSYALDTAKKGDTVQLMNIRDRYSIVSITDYRDSSVEIEEPLPKPQEDEIDASALERLGFHTVIINGDTYIHTEDTLDSLGNEIEPFGPVVTDDYLLLNSDPDEDDDSGSENLREDVSVFVEMKPLNRLNYSYVVLDDDIPYDDGNVTCAVNIVFYDRIYANGIAQFDGVAISRGENGTVRIRIDRDGDEFMKYAKKYEENTFIDIFVNPVGIHNISACDIDEDSGLSLLKFENYSSAHADGTDGTDYNQTPVYRINDCIKVIYSTDFLEGRKVFVPYDTNVPLFFADTDGVYTRSGGFDPDTGDKITYTLTAVNGETYEHAGDTSENMTLLDGEYRTVFSVNDSMPSYNAYSTYRVDHFDPNSKTLVIGGKFNYRKLDYTYDYLRGYSDGGKVPMELDCGDGFYIVRYKDSSMDADFKFVKIMGKERADDPRLDGYYDNNIRTTVQVSKAHRSFARYTIPAEATIEYPDGVTRIYTANDRLYNYLDGTFSFVQKKFSPETAAEYWSGSVDNGGGKPVPAFVAVTKDASHDDRWGDTWDYNIYRYDDPFTLYSSRSYENMYGDWRDPDYIKHIVIDASHDRILGMKKYWKVYRQNLAGGTRTLLFEVENDKLYLSMDRPGIYDVECYAYDTYGNVALTSREAFIHCK